MAQSSGGRGELVEDNEELVTAAVAGASAGTQRIQSETQRCVT